MDKKVTAALLLALITCLAISLYFVIYRSNEDGIPWGTGGRDRTPPMIERITRLRGGGEEWSRLELDLQTGWHLSRAPDAIPTLVNLPDRHEMDKTAVPPPTPIPRKRAIYRTRFSLVGLPDRASCARIQVAGAVSGAKVSLNGQSLGKSEHPDLPFHVDATRALKRQGPNLLELDLVDWKALKVPGLLLPVGSAPKYGPMELHYLLRRAELKGPVRLQLSGTPRIEKIRISPSVSRRTVRVDATLASCSGERVPARVRFQIFSPEGKPGPAQEEAVTVGPSGVTLKAELPGAGLTPWGTPPHGFNILYTLVATVSSRSRVVDQTAERFGYREVRAGTKGLLLNGKRLFLSAKRFGLQQNNYGELKELLSVTSFHGINAWALHQGATQHEPFDLADELGGYHVPGLVCIGGLNPEFHKWPARSRAWLTSYFDAWSDTMHNHPSLLIWGQESLKKIHSRVKKLRFDRPALDIDIRGLQGTYGELMKIKQRLNRGEAPETRPGSPLPTAFTSNLLWIQEIHRAEGGEDIASLLGDFPRTVGISLSLYNEEVTPAWSQELLYNGSSLPWSQSALGVLPDLQITAIDQGTYLVRRWPAAVHHLSGIALEAGEQGRLAMGGPGEVTLIKNTGSGPQRRQAVTIKYAPPSKGRPVLKTAF